MMLALGVVAAFSDLPLVQLPFFVGDSAILSLYGSCPMVQTSKILLSDFLSMGDATSLIRRESFYKYPQCRISTV
jgi:hypothetical protein